MVFVNEFTVRILEIVKYILTLYTWIIIGRAVISWVNADPYNPIVRFIYEVTEPVLGRIRNVLPISFGGIDFSPIVAILGIWVINTFLSSLQQQFVYWISSGAL